MESEEALLLGYNFHIQLLNLSPFITKNDFGKKSCNLHSKEWAWRRLCLSSELTLNSELEHKKVKNAYEFGKRVIGSREKTVHFPRIDQLRDVYCLF